MMQINMKQKEGHLGKEERDETPFRGALEDTDFHPDIKKINLKIKDALKNELPREKVVRTQETFVSLELASERLGKYAAAQKIFNELRNNYDIRIPEMQLIVGKGGEGRITIFVVLDKIEGKNIGDLYNKDLAPKELMALKNKLERLYEGQLDYYHNVLKRGGKYFADLYNGQFVYGKKAGDAEAELYMVDVEPVIYEYNEQNRDKFFEFIMGMDILMKDILGAEDQLKISLAHARKKFSELLVDLDISDKTIPDEHERRDASWMVQNIKKNLNQ